MNTLGLYLHIPFCVQKCRYCDFLSAPANEKTMTEYVKALCSEIEKKAADYKQYIVDTIFIGGGTPSILDSELMERICITVRSQFRLSEKTEWSVECNPGTVTKEKLETYLKTGINRLSFGLQSCDDRELSMLGRIHTYEDFLESYQLARKMEFDNINIDLMSALPEQSKESFLHTLEKVIDLKPEHISAYSLIVEEGTPFYEKYGQMELDEDLDREIYRMTEQKLLDAGYEHYEISNYARPGYASKHNIKYWVREDYLGLGLGASSMVRNERWKNESNLKKYLKNQMIQYEKEVLTRQECMEEYMFLGLRMMKGVSRSKFRELFSQEIMDKYGSVIQKHLQQGLLQQSQDEEYISLTEKGIDVSNYVMADYLD